MLPYYASCRKIFTHGIVNFVTIDFFQARVLLLYTSKNILFKIIIVGGNVGEAAN